MVVLLIIVVQIITEMLPISSSSHVALVQHGAHLAGFGMVAVETFSEHFLHGPTLLVLLIFFRQQWWLMLARFIWPPSTSSWYRLCMLFLRVCLLVSIVVVVSVAWYGFLRVYCKESIVLQSPWLRVVGLSVTGCVLYSTRLYAKTRQSSVDNSSITSCFANAVTLGMVQGIALLPGLSRLACTYAASCFLGYSTRRAFQLAFLVEVPLITGAFFFSGLPGVVHQARSGDFSWWPYVVTIVVATVLSYLALYVSWFLAEKKQLWRFAWYLPLPIFLTVVLAFLRG